LTRYRLMFDSSAWIEHFEGSKIGEKVGELISDDSNEIMTPNIVALEVISKLIRKNMHPGLAKQAIQDNCIPVEENMEDYFEIGELHAELRKKFQNISMSDAIIIFLAKKHNATIVTKDFHMKGQNTIYLK